jgi:DNA-binding MarR family transcriptional regulator
MQEQYHPKKILRSTPPLYTIENKSVVLTTSQSAEFSDEDIMDNLWYDLDDIQKLSRFFLAIFVLIGLIPFFQKSFSRLFDYLSFLRRFRTPIIAPVVTIQDSAPTDPSHMNDMEYIVFTYLAQADAKGVPLPSMANALHMDTKLVVKSLQTLNKKGLVAIRPGIGLIKRFTLSKRGRALALEKGLSPTLSTPAK